MEKNLAGIWIETTMTPEMKTGEIAAFNMPEGTKCLVNIYTAALLVPAHPTNPRRILTLHSGGNRLPLPDCDYEQIKEAIRQKGDLLEAKPSA